MSKILQVLAKRYALFVLRTRSNPNLSLCLCVFCVAAAFRNFWIYFRKSGEDYYLCFGVFMLFLALSVFQNLGVRLLFDEAEKKNI